MVKSLIALAAVQGILAPSQADMEAYVNNYINNTCQYLSYTYNETQQQYVLQDKLISYNEQNANTIFNFTLYFDYTVAERITHYWQIGEALTIYLAYGYDTTMTPNIMGKCEQILTLDSQEGIFKLYDCTTNEWITNNIQVVNEIPKTNIGNQIFVLNQAYANNSELYKAGSEAGYAVGYKTGYGDGKIATTPLNNAFELFKKISTSLSSFWNIPILPGINLGLLISIPITTGIVVWVIRALKE